MASCPSTPPRQRRPPVVRRIVERAPLRRAVRRARRRAVTQQQPRGFLLALLRRLRQRLHAQGGRLRDARASLEERLGNGRAAPFGCIRDGRRRTRADRVSASRRLGGEVGGVPRTRPTKNRNVRFTKKKIVPDGNPKPPSISRAQNIASPAGFPSGAPRGTRSSLGAFFGIWRATRTRAASPRDDARGRRARKSSDVASGS